MAEGTSTNKITFKSDASSPEKGDWDGILFSDSSVDASCKVNHAIIRHAQKGVFGSSATPAELNNNEISDCVYGIQGDFESPTIQDNTLTDNNYGLYLFVQRRGYRQRHSEKYHKRQRNAGTLPFKLLDADIWLHDQR